MTKHATFLLLSLLAPTFASPVPSEDTASQSQGFIYVLPAKGTNLLWASPKEAVGCLNKRGLLTLDDCAVFSRLQGGQGTLSTASGLCSFQDSTMPANKESVYGKGTYAWSCNGVGDGKGNIGDGHGNIGDGEGNIGDGKGDIGDGHGDIGDGKGNIGDGKGNIGDGKGNIGDGKGNAPIAGPGETYYLVGWLTGYSMIGNGNLNFYYDVPALPKSKGEEIQVWRFSWGSLQTDVAEGHQKVTWLWVPVKS